MRGFNSTVSGLKAAQAGLYVTGHNMANSSLKGYSRQRVLQGDAKYQSVGSSANGNMQVGLGTNILAIRQIRNEFLDVAYRSEVSRMGFYTPKLEAGKEIEVIIGEIQGEYATSKIIDDLRLSINELQQYTPGLETRASFVSSAIAFVNKANNVQERMFAQQKNLDLQIREIVEEINILVEEVHKYNYIIKNAEMGEGYANDYRDSRNVALDRLSELVDLDINIRTDGIIELMTDGNQLLVNNQISKIGLKYTAQGYSFIEPVFTNNNEILSYNAPDNTFKRMYNLEGKYNSIKKNDTGNLKGLLVSRGFKPSNYADNPDPTDLTKYPLAEADPQYKRDLFNVEEAFIPKIQKEFDTVINSIVTLINDAVSPQDADPNTAPYGLDGSQFTEVFVRKEIPRYDTNGDFIAENPNDLYSLYTVGNITINPLLLDSSGYNLIALSKSGDIEDNTVALDMLTKWSSNFISVNGSEPMNIDESYSSMIITLGTGTQEAQSYVDSQLILITQVDNTRSSTSGVSLDEEMTNMLKYQHSYNAAARMIQVIDSMMERVINALGRVGI